MPLFPIPTYTSWQLACIAAIEPLNGPSPESIAEQNAIRAELQLRGISEADINDMFLLTKAIGDYIEPMVCMDIDDLSHGIEFQADQGVIDAAEKLRLYEFIGAHLDSPREKRQPIKPKVDLPGPSHAFVFGRIVRSLFRRS